VLATGLVIPPAHVWHEPEEQPDEHASVTSTRHPLVPSTHVFSVLPEQVAPHVVHWSVQSLHDVAFAQPRVHGVAVLHERHPIASATQVWLPALVHWVSPAAEHVLSHVAHVWALAQTPLVHRVVALHARQPLLFAVQVATPPSAHSVLPLGEHALVHAPQL
jgi:hypothetical protein